VLGLIALLFIANTINIGANLAGMGAAAELVLGWGSHVATVAFALVSLTLQLFVSYERYARYLKWLTLVLLAYVAVVFVVKVDWHAAVLGIAAPRFPLTPDSLTVVVAIFGTTITPCSGRAARPRPGSEFGRPRRHHPLKRDAIVLEDLRGEKSIAELCRKEGSIRTCTTKGFLEAGKKRLAGDTAREATSDEVKELKAEARQLKETLAEVLIENRVLKKAFSGMGRFMRYCASEKFEIIELVEQSSLSIRRTLAPIGIPRSTFYDWHSRYQEGGIEALEDGKPRPRRIWNRSLTRSKRRSSIWPPARPRAARMSGNYICGGPPSTRCSRAGSVGCLGEGHIGEPDIPLVALNRIRQHGLEHGLQIARRPADNLQDICCSSASARCSRASPSARVRASSGIRSEATMANK
jgi:transposase-like protein